MVAATTALAVTQQTITQVLTNAYPDPNYGDFTNDWNGMSDLKLNSTFANGYSQIGLRLANTQSKNGKVYLVVTNATTVNMGSYTTWSASISHSNFPPASIYWAEYLAFDNSGASVLAAGQINIHWSIWSDTNYPGYTNIQGVIPFPFATTGMLASVYDPTMQQSPMAFASNLPPIYANTLATSNALQSEITAISNNVVPIVNGGTYGTTGSITQVGNTNVIIFPLGGGGGSTGIGGTVTPTNLTNTVTFAAQTSTPVIVACAGSNWTQQAVVEVLTVGTNQFTYDVRGTNQSILTNGGFVIWTSGGTQGGQGPQGATGASVTNEPLWQAASNNVAYSNQNNNFGGTQKFNYIQLGYGGIYHEISSNIPAAYGPDTYAVPSVQAVENFFNGTTIPNSATATVAIAVSSTQSNAFATVVQVGLASSLASNAQITANAAMPASGGVFGASVSIPGGNLTLGSTRYLYIGTNYWRINGSSCYDYYGTTPVYYLNSSVFSMWINALNFYPTYVDFQGTYALSNLTVGVNSGDPVVMQQFTPVSATVTSNTAAITQLWTNPTNQFSPYIVTGTNITVSLGNGLIQSWFCTGTVNSISAWTRNTNKSEFARVEIWAGTNSFSAITNGSVVGTWTNNGVNLLEGPYNTNLIKVTSF
jgi:hypothetical protein